MIEICNAPVQHIDSWMDLISTVKELFPGLDTPEQFSAYHQTVIKKIQDGSALCALNGDRVIGILLFSREENSLSQLAVHPSFYRQGIASLLILHMMTALDKNRDITVNTYREGDEKGRAARALYKKFGFEEAELCYDQGYPVQKYILSAKST